MQLPKVELHRHLSGSLRMETAIGLAEEYNIDIPSHDPTRLAQIIRPKPADSLLGVLNQVGENWPQIFGSQEAVHRVAFETAEDAWNDGIIYLEVRLNPMLMAGKNKATAMQIVQGTIEGLEDAESQFSIKTNIILSHSRQMGHQTGYSLLDLALKYQTAIDLSGDETSYPPSDYVNLFAIAQAKRLPITIHAGEGAGSKSVRAALRVGAQRIGHGVRAWEDPHVVDLLRDRRITVECCPTCNVATGAAETLESHPLKQFLEYGVPATINTDDPSWFGITLSDEYYTAHTKMGLSLEQLHECTVYAATGAFLPREKKNELVRKIKEGWGRFF